MATDDDAETGEKTLFQAYGFESLVPNWGRFMITIDKASRVPVYAQMVQAFKSLVMLSKVHAHERIPSVRRMAAQLQVNPNTVQKAYALLKREQIIYSVAGKGDFVADNAEAIKQMKRQSLTERLSALAVEARGAGMWIDEIFTIIDDAYSGG
jgi:GntR family transcriptional regulator